LRFILPFESWGRAPNLCKADLWWDLLQPDARTFTLERSYLLSTFHFGMKLS